MITQSGAVKFDNWAKSQDAAASDYV